MVVRIHFSDRPVAEQMTLWLNKSLERHDVISGH